MSQDLYTTTVEIENSRLFWKQGVLVAIRKRGFYKMELYQTEDAYAEVIWHTHFNVIVKVRRFTSLQYLGPYLPQISLSVLLD